MPSSSRTGDKPEIPEPFRAALQGGEPGRVSDHPAEAPLERYGRGLARTVVGREADARADFQAASDALGDICRVELGFLDIRDRSGLRRALQASEELLDLHAGPCFLRARSLHLKGLALGKLRRSRLSVQALFDAQNLYREIGEGLLSAQVQDTLGMVFGASGQLDLALTYYSLSLVQKLAGGDRYGAAISLGNMGRVHLRAGRYREAMVCL
ncbi:MAG: tetratricopeptide repeat protein, partial [Planctomycetota bacterium]